jgi:hypothetical protein
VILRYCTGLTVSSTREAGEFFAKLVSIADMDALPEEAKLELLRELRSIFGRTLEEMLYGRMVSEYEELVASSTFGGDESPEALHFKRVGEARSEASRRTLKHFHGQARNLILGLVAGASVLLPPTQTRSVARLKGRRLVETKAELDIWSPLLDLLRQRPFPFGRCKRESCGRVFFQAGRGKPRSFCSERCKAKGIPSAAKRTEYARTRRRRKRQREIEVAKNVLRGAPKEERFARLQRAFPQKTRQQLLYLRKRTEGTRRES